MVRASVRFELETALGRRAERVEFVGYTDLRKVELLITMAGLAELPDPNIAGIDRQTAIETFVEFQADIHRIALREFVSRLGCEPPILLTVANVTG